MSEAKPRVNHAVQILRVVLVIAAALVLIFSAGLGIFSVAGSYDQTRGEAIFTALACALAGLILAVLLIVASSVVGMLSNLVDRAAAPHDDVRPALDRLEQSLRMINNLQNHPDALADSGAVRHRERPVALIEQLCDILLMDESQRQRFAQRHWTRRKQTHLEAIEREVLIGDWTSAFARLDELRIVMPEDRQVAELRERVESEENSRLEEDIQVTRGRLRQLLSAALWQPAEDAVASLRSKYPGKAEVDSLGEEVRRERDAWDRENMERLFNDISSATERHQWRQATLAVEDFIRRYPLDSRAERLRLDLPTLQENAAAQDRKEQEELFKDLLKRQRYDEAIVTAKAVIAKYPHSATATELNKLLPKVEELARQEPPHPASSPATPPTPQPAPAPASPH